MKPKHLIITLLALLTSMTALADVPDGNINFKDPEVKAICINNWDTNGDGELSYAEAAAVTEIRQIFKDKKNIVSFDEFQYFTSVTSTIVNSISGYAFANCTRLTNITLPSSMTFIAVHTFSDCRNLTTINIPEGVSTIKDYAFDGCSALSSIHFASTTPKVTYKWPGTAVLFVPDEAVSAYKDAWTDYAYQVVPETSASYVYQVNVTANESSSAVINEIGEDEALNVVKLKVSGTINSYDVMAFRNKMKNLRELDLSDAKVVASDYIYYNSCKTKDNIITGNFAPPYIVKMKPPKDIISLENNAFNSCSLLRSMELPEGITSIPLSAFAGCSQLGSIIIPPTVTSIEFSAFYACQNLTSIYLPERLLSIGANSFQSCSFEEIHLPPYLTSIGDAAFSQCPLKKVYAYMPDIISIGSNTFSSSIYTTANCYIPEFLYNNYYYDTNWSQFLNVIPTELKPDDYKSLSIQKTDVGTYQNGTNIPLQSNGDAVDVELGLQGSFTAGENLSPTDEYAQFFNHADIIIDGEGHGGSLIGQDDGSTPGNLRVNTMRVKINVKAGRWYFFCFPYDVTIANCTYPGQYAWRWYDGAERATNGSGGWKPVEGTTLNARQGYAFQTSHTGNLIVEFSNPTFGGNRPKTLVAHAAANAANASWNLVGNPYSSFYDFLAVDFDAPITVYNSNGTYSAYRPADDECHLQPFEAFFVQKPTEVDAINFNADRRESYNQGQTKKAERQKIRRRMGLSPQRRLINLEILSGEELVDKTRVVFNNEKSHAYELDCDAAKMMSGDAKAQLYSVENGVNMAINERPLDGDIRLGYTAKTAGTLSISASRMDMPMMLVDTQLGTTFDLSLGSYDFDTAAGTFDNRFMLCMSNEATAINDMTAKTGICIGTQDGGIAIGGAEGKTINIFTTGGAQAAQHSGNGYIALKSGVYVVSVDGVSAKVSVK